MEEKSLLLNVHSNLEPPKPDGNTFLMRGNYHYYHYGCDGFQDMVASQEGTMDSEKKSNKKLNSLLVDIISLLSVMYSGSQLNWDAT
uniref:Uncharacterized protein n=1 Tax=Anopheles minimus TaxID=112268 RepID=A0A182WKB5_9DIPT